MSQFVDRSTANPRDLPSFAELLGQVQQQPAPRGVFSNPIAAAFATLAGAVSNNGVGVINQFAKQDQQAQQDYLNRQLTIARLLDAHQQNQALQDLRERQLAEQQQYHQGQLGIQNRRLTIEEQQALASSQYRKDSLELQRDRLREEIRSNKAAELSREKRWAQQKQLYDLNVEIAKRKLEQMGPLDPRKAQAAAESFRRLLPPGVKVDPALIADPSTRKMYVDTLGELAKYNATARTREQQTELHRYSLRLNALSDIMRNGTQAIKYYDSQIQKWRQGLIKFGKDLPDADRQKAEIEIAKLQEKLEAAKKATGSAAKEMAEISKRLRTSIVPAPIYGPGPSGFGGNAPGNPTTGAGAGGLSGNAPAPKAVTDGTKVTVQPGAMQTVPEPGAAQLNQVVEQWQKDHPQTYEKETPDPFTAGLVTSLGLAEYGDKYLSDKPNDPRKYKGKPDDYVMRDPNKIMYYIGKTTGEFILPALAGVSGVPAYAGFLGASAAPELVRAARGKKSEDVREIFDAINAAEVGVLASKLPEFLVNRLGKSKAGIAVRLAAKVGPKLMAALKAGSVGLGTYTAVKMFNVSPEKFIRYTAPGTLFFIASGPLGKAIVKTLRASAKARLVGNPKDMKAIELTETARNLETMIEKLQTAVKQEPALAEELAAKLRSVDQKTLDKALRYLSREEKELVKHTAASTLAKTVRGPAVKRGYW